MRNFSYYGLALVTFFVGSVNAMLTVKEKKALEKTEKMFGINARDINGRLSERNAVQLAETMQDFYALVEKERGRVAVYEAREHSASAQLFFEKIKYYTYGPGLSLSVALCLSGACAAIAAGIAFRELTDTSVH